MSKESVQFTEMVRQAHAALNTDPLPASPCRGREGGRKEGQSWEWCEVCKRETLWLSAARGEWEDRWCTGGCGQGWSARVR